MRAHDRSRIWIATLTLALALMLGCRGGDHSDRDRPLPPDEAKRVLVDRNWLDSWPTGPRDHLFVYRFTPAMGGGVFQDRTLFKGTFELFRFSTDGRELELDLPETGEHVHSDFRIERVDGPAPFDLRLTLAHSPRGPAVFYGRRDETAASALVPAMIP